MSALIVAGVFALAALATGGISANMQNIRAKSAARAQKNAARLMQEKANMEQAASLRKMFRERRIAIAQGLQAQATMGTAESTAAQQGLSSASSQGNFNMGQTRVFGETNASIAEYNQIAANRNYQAQRDASYMGVLLSGLNVGAQAAFSYGTSAEKTTTNTDQTKK